MPSVTRANARNEKTGGAGCPEPAAGAVAIVPAEGVAPAVVAPVAVAAALFVLVVVLVLVVV